MGDASGLATRRIAIVGCGGAGKMHVEALARAGLAPTALVDPDTHRRTALGRLCPGAVLAPSPGRVVEEFDLAIVAAPDQVHASVAIELLEAGKDVIVEKPMAGTRADAAAMVAAADASSRLLAIGHIRRNLAVNPWVCAVLRSGVLGAVERVDAAHGGRDDWIASSGDYTTQSLGGVLANQGAHTLDVLNWWFGPLTVVSCTDDRHGGREADTTVELLADTVPVRLQLSRIRTMRNTVCITTERGVLEVALDHYQPKQLVALPDGLDLDRFGLGRFVEVEDDLSVQFDRQLVSLAAALEGRWPDTLATAREGAGVAAVLEDCDAIRTSQELWWMRSAVTETPAAVSSTSELAPSQATTDRSTALPAVGVIGVTGAVGSRFVEIVGGEERAPLRALVHRWWHTARTDRYAVDLRDIAPVDDVEMAETFAASLAGCSTAVSFIDGPEADAALAESLIDGCTRSGVARLVHLGCLSSFGAIATGRLDERVEPTRPPGSVAARRWEFEQTLLSAGARAGIDVAVVTAPLIYGPFTERGAHLPFRQVEHGRVVIARGSGACHVVYVDDAVEAVWSAVVAPGTVHGRTFVTGPVPMAWEDFYGAFESIVGRPATALLSDGELRELVLADPAEVQALRWPPIPGTAGRVVHGVRRRLSLGRVSVPVRRRLVVPDADELAVRAIDVEVPLDRAATVLGWTPVIGFDEGMRRTAAYLRWADPRERT